MTLRAHIKHVQRRWWATGWLLALSLYALIAGCTAGAPRGRLGSLPFPGPFSLYAVADPFDLGTHRYAPFWERLGEEGEWCDRGTLYTCRAGFLDIAHLRQSADWVRWLHPRVLAALQGGPSEITLSKSAAQFTITITPPERLGRLDAAERDAVAQETAIQASQRLSVIILTWHEVATWHGEESIPPIPEWGSSFTWDDGTSHVVGAMVGAAALRATLISGESWDHAVTCELRRCVDEFYPVPLDHMRQAIAAVKGRWWSGVEAVRRDLQTGLESGSKRPWLVPGLNFCSGAEEADLRIPDLSNVRGHDMRSSLRIQIAPSGWIMHRVLGCDECPKVLGDEHAMLKAIERVRAEMLAEWGEGFDQP